MKFLKNLFKERSGPDKYGLFLAVTSVVIMLIGIIANNVPGVVLMLIATANLVRVYLRMISKNTAKRKAENDAYMLRRALFFADIKIIRRTLKEGRKYRFFKCGKCAAVVRIPKGAGPVEITCPLCGSHFGRKA